jgi:hypothetical protein
MIWPLLALRRNRYLPCASLQLELAGHVRLRYRQHRNPPDQPAQPWPDPDDSHLAMWAALLHVGLLVGAGWLCYVGYTFIL